MGQQTRDLVLVNYSWSKEGLLTGVLLNNGSTPVDLRTAQVIVFYAPLSLGGTCSGLILSPRQLCAFSISTFAEYTITNTFGTGTNAYTWTQTDRFYTVGWTSEYQLRIVMEDGYFLFELTYGESSNKPERGIFVPSGAQTAVATIGRTTSASTHSPLISGSFASMTTLMLAAVTLGVLLVAAILVVRVLVRERPEEHGLYGDR